METLIANSHLHRKPPIRVTARKTKSMEVLVVDELNATKGATKKGKHVTEGRARDGGATRSGGGSGIVDSLDKAPEATMATLGRQQRRQQGGTSGEEENAREKGRNQSARKKLDASGYGLTEEESAYGLGQPPTEAYNVSIFTQMPPHFYMLRFCNNRGLCSALKASFFTSVDIYVNEGVHPWYHPLLRLKKFLVKDLLPFSPSSYSSLHELNVALNAKFYFLISTHKSESSLASWCSASKMMLNVLELNNYKDHSVLYQMTTLKLDLDAP
ncbi:hypothetical protein V8G54_009238 [Vigna mungo]|uniref:Uncharacterized protein n=1 Tax=Vigna mungo TaxID=3915 RepID=A0AAQ3NTL5_VIGMU